ncbi:MAG TPA: tocopherol cyclase family protein [Paludibacter sp.]|nr:tocopherol cyclase family protein [Paludibacter sp.]
MKIFKPELFQGNLSSENYFEGWYFKHVSRNLDNVYSFIPGVSLNPRNPHAFIQVINGVSGSTQYIEYPLSAFRHDKRILKIQIGESEFTRDKIVLDIHAPEIKISGQLVYSAAIRYPASFFSPGIMGWYSFIPFMECKHAVVSVSHRIDGSLLVNNRLVSFSGGKGYVEKDWGRSFPESWIWLHSNNFQHSDACVMMSIAKIPWLGSFFPGLIAFLYVDGRFYCFCTYNKSEIVQLDYDGQILQIVLRNQRNELVLKATLNKSGILLAPVSGKMERHIKESIDSEVEVALTDLHGNEIYHDTAARTGLEVIEGIFNVVKMKGK